MLRILPILVLAAGLPAAAAAAPPHTATPRDTRPETLAVAPLRTPFACGGRDTLALVPGLVDTLRGDTTGGPTDLDGYACRLWAERGPEHVYRLEVAAELELWAGLAGLDPELDLDLFLLDGCDTDACLVGANVEFSARLPAGTYYLVVDGYGPSDTLNAGPYEVVLETRHPGIPPEVCAGAAEPLACAVGSTIDRSGSLFGQPDRVLLYDCSPRQARAGEVWYALDLLPGQGFVVDMPTVAPELDAVLWLFDGCGPGAQCLAVADERTAGQPETLSWRSTVAAPVTVWLAVDGQRAAETPEAGSFELAITCGTEVPVGRTSFGALRGLYR